MQTASPQGTPLDPPLPVRLKLSALWASVWLAVRPGLPFWQGVVLVTLGSLVCWGATRGR